MASIPTPTRRPVDTGRVEHLTRELLVALGEDPDREGLADTPRRVAAWWTDFLDRDHGTLGTTFTHSTTHDDFVLLRGIEVWSLCEHHLLPFRLTVSIAYVPQAQVLGLSKLVRQLRVHAHALQLQERITADVAGDLAKAAGTDDVAVYAEGEHLCMSMRGVETGSVRTVTSCRLGRTASDPELAARIERLALASAR
ncbi:GTP cyclohydrolase I [Kitasatospora acidiphila]|uniref:GTP cyclohydrolase 1 n=1 Tax=Kitasatospora acidiphila TaxID=2567942 RepID=A0A540W952_9ACTN|nr:GTP cyclohydrolase I [Kitasatospora acidiphila]TQF05556.1 GTP cyclohydrolase I [Kitasatospora acidiphila]